MPRLLVTTREGETQEFQAQQGVSVMAAIRAAGVDELLALCGGSCSCATCHVYVDQRFLAQLAPIRHDEN